MNDFNAILGKMKSWANAAGKKTEEVVESSKLKLQIVSLNGELSKAYEALGKMIFHAAKNNETVGEEMDEAMDKIDELLEKLAELEGKVGEIKKSRTCGNCGAVCAQDAQFCSRCGVILSVVSENDEEETVELDEENEKVCCCDGDCDECEKACGECNCAECEHCKGIHEIDVAELLNDEECCGNCHCSGDCDTCDEGSNKNCDRNCAECDCCDEDCCECTAKDCCKGGCCGSCEEQEEEKCGGDCGCCCGSCGK